MSEDIKSSGGWKGIQESIGFNFDLADSHSHSAFKYKEESFQSIPKQFSNHHEVERQPLFTFNAENTVNFTDMQRLDMNSVSQDFQLYSKSGNENDIYEEEESRPIKDSRSDSPSIEKKKGLKYLAKLLYHTLQKKKLSINVHKQVVSQIQSSLSMRFGHDSNSKLREEKNVRRRIYDALNVMVAAGLLERQMTQMPSYKMKNQSHSSLSQRNYSLTDKKKELSNKIAQIQQRIKLKKAYIKQLKEKKIAINHCISKNLKRSQLQEDFKLKFPLVFVLSKEEDCQIFAHKKESLEMECKDMNIFSETDLLQQKCRIDDLYNQDIEQLIDQSQKGYF